MEQNNNQNAILQMLLKEKGMNDFYLLKNVPASNAWAYQDNEGNLTSFPYTNSPEKMWNWNTMKRSNQTDTSVVATISTA